MKAIKVGIRWIWFYGLVLIGLYLLVEHNVEIPSLPTQFITNAIRRTGFHFEDSKNPRIVIFSGPAPFTGSVGARQVVAVQSWLALSSQVNVVLFSQHPSVASFASASNNRVSVDNHIDFTFHGTPYFNSMVERARAFPGDIFVFVEPDTILLPDLVSALNLVNEAGEDWLLVASLRNVSNFPFRPHETGNQWITWDGRRVGSMELLEALVHDRVQTRCSDRTLIAWNSKNAPLHNGVLPPFLFGKGTHNHWIINEALSAKSRIVLDASMAISGFFIDHPVSDDQSRSLENVSNSLLAKRYGSWSSKEMNLPNAIKLLQCGDEYLLLDTKQEIVVQRTSNKRAAFHLVKNKMNYVTCVDENGLSNGTSDCQIRNNQESLQPFNFQFSLEDLLSITADKNKTIVLAVAEFNYMDMLMSWVCRLRHLEVTNFLIHALDQETYEFSLLQGLPVFYDHSSTPNNTSDCYFGTECFKRLTKVKSRTVLRILKLGYNVLFCDADIHWFRNPLPYLYPFGPAVLVAQSDEPKAKGPKNLPKTINSGFYLARSDKSTIMAMEKVVKHASTSSLSEQPSFYDVLCGEGGRNRVGDDKCVEPETNLTVHFLDKNLFPNGAHFGIWRSQNVTATCEKLGCFILHNNWIVGQAKKLERLVQSGLCEYDVNKKMCLRR